MKRCISFSLWGDKPMYCKGALENIRLAKTVYPGWTCRFVIPSGNSVLHGRGNMERRVTDIPSEVLEQLEAEGAEIVRCDESSWNLMMARFYAIEDYDVVLIRDADSRLTFREKAAVDVWLESDKHIHAMRDHPWHGTPILGGMWGLKKGILDDIRERSEKYLAENPNDFWQVDQLFLRNVVWPEFFQHVMTHASYCQILHTDMDFPTVREAGQYVGQPFDEENKSVISLDGRMKLPERLEDMEPNIRYFRDDERPFFKLDSCHPRHWPNLDTESRLQEEAH